MMQMERHYLNWNLAKHFEIALPFVKLELVLSITTLSGLMTDV